MRQAIKQSLALSGIQADDKDLAYLEVQMQVTNYAAKSLKDFQLYDVVPASVFRAEVGSE